ncbi:dimethylhistidine N-methyltransferase [Reichenbachiella agariperforans]|uniref:Dimethylhistidine N-methyltransferase n=1 Tax=Reichenbachiella agariperforans TaxID=156994 RepID=A0A1M6LV23_REIAG|nr:L-histidine N(alpha)-methyltransferase [Reichenbachiella agariperforans]SHJ75108.1 dimethylhistidine N-methyltransferase [Reichenbachiella agariperforans]
MPETIEIIQNKTFLNDTLKGLKSKPKTLSSKYFYNKRGDELFQQIMKLDEYYLTDAEYSIFESQKDNILKAFSPNGEDFNLVEFGAGDGYKTKVLLQHFVSEEALFDYIPIDISQHALDGLAQSLAQTIPELSITPMQGDYFQVLDRLSHSSTRRNVILFLGSNIGNFSFDQAQNFLSKIREDINTGDQLLIGVDLKKDPTKILAAYNDSKGVTAAFNMNLLNRINEELGGNFNLESFQHYPFYNPVTGECKSAIMSLKDQEVLIGEEIIAFKKWETMQTEISKKYSTDEIQELAEKCGFEVRYNLEDQNGYFVDSIWSAV